MPQAPDEVFDRCRLRRAVGWIVLASLLIPFIPGHAAAGSIELISKADPVPDSYGQSFFPAPSADGRYIAFSSDAPNLVPGQEDANLRLDVFIRDRIAGSTTLVSHAAGSPAKAGNSVSGDARISSDGRYVAFLSWATDLVPGATDANHTADVFLYDRLTGVNTLVSHAAGAPSTAADGTFDGVRISADGNFIVFTSTAKNLVAGQSPAPGGQALSNVFLYSRASGSLTLISHAAGLPSQVANGGAGNPEISADGGYVVFESGATDLVSGLSGPAPSPGSYAYLFERSSGKTSLASHAASSPLQRANASAFELRISADGRWTAFLSWATDLVPGQVENGSATGRDAFLYDRISGTVRLASHKSGSPQAAAGTAAEAGPIALSADGRFLGFPSAAPDLVAGQVNLAPGTSIFLFDRTTGEVSLVSHHRDSRTTTPAAPRAASVSLSADGRYIAFESTSNDLISRQTDETFSVDVFIQDRTSQTTILASHAQGSLTTAAHSHSYHPVLSSDGSVVVFEGLARDLAAGPADPNGFQDIFAVDRKSLEAVLVSPRDPGLPPVAAYGPSSIFDISADGRFVLFGSMASGLVPGQVDLPYQDLYETTGTWDLFLRDRITGRTTLVSRSTSSPPTAMGGIYYQATLSRDGKWAAFFRIPKGSSSNLGEVYLYERATDKLTLVNATPGYPAIPEGYPSGQLFLGADGRYLTYTCTGCRLTSGQTPDRYVSNVFLYDRVTGSRSLISHVSGSAVDPADDNSQVAGMSADGRFVVFISRASNLVPGQAGSNGGGNAFLYDRTTGGVTLLNHAVGSAATLASRGAFPVISADGRWIVFSSRASDLVAGLTDTNDADDAFLHDRVSGTTTLISRAGLAPQTTANGGSFALSMSADGRWVLLSSSATDLVSGVTDLNETQDLYLFDRVSGTSRLLTFAAGSPATTTAPPTWFVSSALSADGSRVVFASPATDLLPGQTDADRPVNLFVQDVATGARTKIGRLHTSGPLATPGGIFFSPALSADGRQVAFTTDSTRFVTGDLNGTWDVYLFDFAGTNGPVTVPPCTLFDTRRAGDRPALRSNQRKVLTAAGSCGVPAAASRVTLKVTALQGSGAGNLRLYPGDTSAPAAPAGLLRFLQGQTATATFDIPLAAGKLAVLPFVRANGTVDVVVEVDGYTP